MKIDVPFTHLERMAHVADIHIRLIKRHDEYRAVFSTLYAQLRATDLTNGVIVVAGDIVHAKTDMSPEMVDLASEFLKSLADIAPTIVIAGNHDLNLSNKDRLDSLSPLIKSLDHKNLHYLKHSGIYQLADADVVVFSILDEKEDWPSVTDCRPKVKKIGLFHGPVHGATTDVNYTIVNRHIENQMFDGLDMVLLGDIHKYQILQERSKNKPVIVYSSSLIQQNHGEALTGHGWCNWDVDAVSHQFISVPNTFGFYTVELVDDNIVIPSDMPENVRLRIFSGDADASTVKKLTTVLRKRHNIIEISVNKTKTQLPVAQTVSSTTVVDLADTTTQDSLIRDWIERTHENIDEDSIKKILDVNTTTNALITHEEYSRNVHWNPINFKFSNMFSYGENNEIKFDTMSGLYGIFAPNATGKSASVDALIFCLYDKTPRAFRGDHIINNRRDSFECELNFHMDSESYFIRRTGTRKKNGDVKVDVSFWKENADGTHVSLNGEDRRDTNINIRNYVGSYDDFVLTTLSSQSGNALFIDKSHSERKDMLIQFMGLNVFDKLHEAANEEIKEISGALKKFKKLDFTQTLVDLQTSLDAVRGKHEVVETTLTSKTEERTAIYSKLKNWQDKKRPLPNIETNIDKLKSKLARELVGVIEYGDKKAKANELIKELRNTITSNESLQQQNDIILLKRESDEYDLVEEDTRLATTSLKSLISKIEEKEKFKNKLENYKFNPECDICVDNNQNVISDLDGIHTELTTSYLIKTAFEERLLENVDTKNSLQSSKDKYLAAAALVKIIDDLHQKVGRVQSEIAVADVTIDKFTIQSEQTQKDIDLYHINEENIKFNADVDDHITHLEYDITAITTVLSKLEKTLRDYHGEIKVLEASKADIMNQITEAEALEDTYEAYRYYLEAVGRDGVPHEMLSRTLPLIEAEINNILTQLVDFTITLEIDGKNILGKVNYDMERIWPLENSSGMERFISSLAIRVALLNVSNLPKPNFLIIDEGMGVLDVENLSAMQVLFGLLKTQFDFVVIISHLEATRDMVDKVITIKREDEFSYITV